MKTVQIEEGDRVVTAAHIKGEDADAGRVIEVDGNKALVSWDSGVRTWVALSDIVAE